MLALALLLFLQGVPVTPFQSGSITGVLTTSAGKPAVGVRVSALARPDSASDALAASSLAGISETDQNGVYKLENVPPGRYYIVAGRIDLPTFYPGTLEMASGKDVLVTAGAALSGLNFALKDNSVGRADTVGFAGLLMAWTVPIQVKVEGGRKVPLSDGGLSPVLRLTNVQNNQKIEVPFSTTSFAIPLAVNPEYRVTVENLSSRYAVRSIVSDKANLLVDRLKLPAPTGPIALPPPATLTTGGTTTGFVRVFSATTVGPMSPPPPVPTIEITLTETAAAPRTGATLSGMLPAPLERNIEASGIPGSVYADGTFEVRNVPAGRHTLLTRNNPAGTRPVGVSIVVGNQDIPNIQLQQILEIPRDLDTGIVAAGTHSPGAIIRLANVSGVLVDESTGARFEVGRSIGRITINGNTVSYTVNNTGEFDIPGLLPGRYDLELFITGGKSYTRVLEMRDENMTLQWPVTIPD